eukprot:15361055-Ditylum_brightwellii.AAC.1
MACHKGHMHHECKEVRHSSKKVCFQCKGQYKAKLHGLSSEDKKDLNTFVDVKTLSKATAMKRGKGKDKGKDQDKILMI